MVSENHVTLEDDEDIFFLFSEVKKCTVVHKRLYCGALEIFKIILPWNTSI